jgi:hypothetical protein
VIIKLPCERRGVSSSESFLFLYRKAKKNAHFAGMATGSTLCIVNLTFAATFRYGATLVVDYDITLKEMMT